MSTATAPCPRNKAWRLGGQRRTGALEVGRSCHTREQGPHPKMGGSQAGLSGSRKKQVKQCPEPGGPTRGLKQRVWGCHFPEPWAMAQPPTDQLGEKTKTQIFN